jgi:hypothetical protein
MKLLTDVDSSNNYYNGQGGMWPDIYWVWLEATSGA